MGYSRKYELKHRRLPTLKLVNKKILKNTNPIECRCLKLNLTHQEEEEAQWNKDSVCLLVLSDCSRDLYSKSWCSIECLTVLADCSQDHYNIHRFGILFQRCVPDAMILQGGIHLVNLGCDSSMCKKQQYIMVCLIPTIVQPHKVRNNFFSDETVMAAMMVAMLMIWCGWYDGDM